MHYDTTRGRHGLKFDPFKALVAPRPIGWIGTLGADGTPNLAPYSFFNAISDKPAMVAFSSAGFKDSLRNVLASGEFTCSMATWDLREAMNMSSAAVQAGVDEFALTGLHTAPSLTIAAPRVAEAPAALECRLWKTLELPHGEGSGVTVHTLVIGYVVGIYIDDAAIKDGLVQTAAMRPLARMGYMEYATVTPETTFTMNRPQASEDGRSATLKAGPWDGVYR
jgi:flavin reductase (DIM6/NTAB) family NADH-FMN oxidoreductase RutF